MHRARATGLLTATTLALASLAACGDESEPDPTTSTASPIDKGTDSSSSTASDSPSSSDQVVELPKAAQERTKAGAIAFNEFYQLQMGEALKSGETDTIKRYSYKCDVCANYAKRIDDRTAQGIKMDKNPNSVREASAAARSDSGYKVTVTVHAAEYHEVLKDGAAGRTADKVTYTVATNTQWHQGHWVIRDSVIVK